MRSPISSCLLVLVAVSGAACAPTPGAPAEAPQRSTAQPARAPSATLPLRPGARPTASEEGAPIVEIPLAARFDADGVYHLDPALPLPMKSWRPPTSGLVKKDESDDVRAAAPESFAITAPPQRIATVRPMVEWEPMQALAFAFPSYALQYPGTYSTFVQVTKQASEVGEVWIVVDNAQAESGFKQRLLTAGVASEKLGTTIRFFRQPFDTYWFIDFGPLPIIDTATDTYAFADFRYYHERPLDDGLPTGLGRGLPLLGAPSAVTTYRMPLSVEGGTFQSTTTGICITGSRQIYNMSCEAGSCRESILGLSLAALQTHQYTLEMKSVLAAYAGCKDLIVTHSISDDGTGHIDMYLKILDDHRVLIGDYKRPYDNEFQRENHTLMNDNATFLEAYVLPDGGHFEVKRMVMPGHRTIDDPWSGTMDIPFTYINSTFFNGLNLWPAYTFSEWTTSRAAAEATWREIMPEMNHIWIDAEELSYQSGAIHCVTRTIPRKTPALWVGDGTCNGGSCAAPSGGYDDACTLTSSSDDLCYGPEWLCGCNDCERCPVVEEPRPCGAVKAQGCCAGGDVLYCEGGTLARIPCGGSGCGWDAGQGVYGCGLVGEDPSGQLPAACACVPQCEGKTCGDDGCGGTCGTCAADGVCVAGTCRDDCATCTPGEMGCDGATSWLCVEGQGGCHAKQSVDCAGRGLTCTAGECVSVPRPDADDVVEADTVADTTEADTADTADTAAGDTAGEDAIGGDTSEAEVIATGGRGDDGCVGGGGGVLGLGVLGLGLLRRRRA
jgi:agmatine/peptidylarginine deiminase